MLTVAGQDSGSAASRHLVAQRLGDPQPGLDLAVGQQDQELVAAGARQHVHVAQPEPSTSAASASASSPAAWPCSSLICFRPSRSQAITVSGSPVRRARVSSIPRRSSSPRRFSTPVSGSRAAVASNSATSRSTSRFMDRTIRPATVIPAIVTDQRATPVVSGTSPHSTTAVRRARERHLSQPGRSREEVERVDGHQHVEHGHVRHARRRPRRRQADQHVTMRDQRLAGPRRRRRGPEHQQPAPMAMATRLKASSAGVPSRPGRNTTAEPSSAAGRQHRAADAAAVGHARGGGAHLVGALGGRCGHRDRFCAGRAAAVHP